MACLRCAVCLVTLLFFVSDVRIDAKYVDLQFTWSHLEYALPASYKANNDPNQYDSYILENNLLVGVNRWKNKLFLTAPRRRSGIPATLNFIWLNSTQRHNVPLIPYPDWNTNRMNTANDNNVHLISAYRMVVDECDRLWVIDSGKIESFAKTGTTKVFQNPSIVVIDLHTDKVIRRYFLKDSDIRPTTSTVNLAVDVERSTCDDAYVYIEDILGYGLIVYSFRRNDSWRMTHKYFYLESLSGDITVSGIKFQFMDGIFSVGLSSKNPDGYRTAFFHPFAGSHLFSVSTQVLRDKVLATRAIHGDDVKVLFDRGPDTQTTSSDLHKPTGAIFFAFINQNALGCWNIYKRRTSSLVDLVFKHDEAFIYPADVKVSGDDVYVVTNRLPEFTFRGLNFTETNYRVWSANVYNAIRQTTCE